MEVYRPIPCMFLHVKTLKISCGAMQAEVWLNYLFLLSQSLDPKSQYEYNSTADPCGEFSSWCYVSLGRSEVRMKQNSSPEVINDLSVFPIDGLVICVYHTLAQRTKRTQ